MGALLCFTMRASRSSILRARVPAVLHIRVLRAHARVLHARIPAAARLRPAAARPIPAATRPIPAATRPIPAATRPIPAATRPIPAATRPIPAATRLPTVLALALAAALCGCGKTLPSTPKASQRTIVPVSREGVAGVATKNTTRLGGADPATDAAAVALAVYPGLTPATRPQAVALVDERDWPAALVASALAGAPLKAPLLYSKGSELPEVSAQALRTLSPTGASSLGGAQVLQVAASAGDMPGLSGNADLRAFRTLAVSDADPYALAVRVQRLLATSTGRTPRQVIVASADGPPAQAMPAAGLAAESGAPILLVSTTSVPAATATALAHLHRPAIYVVGSTAAVSNTVLVHLAHFGPVQRIISPVGHIARGDVVGNSVAVALYNNNGFGWGVDEPGHGLAFLSALDPLDAPAAAPLSANGDYAPPLLLEGPTGVPKVLSEYLAGIRGGYSKSSPAYPATHGGNYNHGWLIGDESTISARTQAELDTMLEIAPQSE
jgi:hypothetical protein